MMAMMIRKTIRPVIVLSYVGFYPKRPLRKAGPCNAWPRTAAVEAAPAFRSSTVVADRPFHYCGDQG
jgi:hypothetical protein